MKYKLGKVIFDSQKHTLTCSNHVRELDPKSYELLIVFISNHNDVLSREQLIKLAWQGRVVSDSAINKAVSKLRQHFEALIPNIEVISTKAKFGYVLSCPVEKVSYKKHKAIFSYTALGLFSATLLMVFMLHIMPLSPSTGTEITHLERVTAHSGIEIHISASKLGELLYVTAESAANKPSQLILRSTEKRQESILPLNPKYFHSPVISPSGNTVAGVNKQNNGCQITFYDINKNKQLDIFDCVSMEDIKLTWQSNEEAVFIRARKSNAAPFLVYRIMRATKSIQQISLPIKEAQFSGDFLIAAHPSKNLLAYARYSGVNKTQIHIIDTISLDKVATYDINHSLNAMTWHVATETLYLANQKSIYEVQEHSRKISLITQLSYPVHSISASQVDGKDVLFLSQYHASTKLQTFNINTKATTTTFANAALNRLPKKLKNNKTLFVSDIEQQHDLWITDNDSQRRLILPFEFGFTRYHINHTEEYVVFEKAGAVYEYELSSLTLNKVFDATHKAYAVNYTNNNHDLLYGSNKTGQWQLWYFDRQLKQHKQLTQHGGYSGYLYKDKLYFTKRDHSGLWTLNQNKEVRIIEKFSNINWLNWQIVNDSIYFYRKTSGIWSYDLKTTEERLVMPTPHNFVHQYTVHADQQSITYVHIQPMQGDIQKLTMQAHD